MTTRNQLVVLIVVSLLQLLICHCSSSSSSTSSSSSSWSDPTKHRNGTLTFPTNNTIRTSSGSTTANKKTTTSYLKKRNKQQQQQQGNERKRKSKIKSVTSLNHSTKNSTNGRSRNQYSRSKIVGGKIIQENNFAFHVIPNNLDFLCGGTLIHKDIVLTAAHCDRAYQRTNSICLGGNDVLCTTARRKINVTQYVKHPLNNPTFFIHDLMLMKLVDRAPGPFAVLNFNKTTPIDGDKVVVIGYGRTSEISTIVSRKLKRVTVKVMNHTFCENYWDTLNVPLSNEENVLCTGTVNGGKDSCAGDSGGPIFLSNSRIQIGITSFGRGCARPNVPSVNGKISGYEEWIKNTICTLSSFPPSYCTSTPPPPLVEVVGNNTTSSSSSSPTPTPSPLPLNLV